MEALKRAKAKGKRYKDARAQSNLASNVNTVRSRPHALCGRAQTVVWGCEQMEVAKIMTGAAARDPRCQHLTLASISAYDLARPAPGSFPWKATPRRARS